MKTLMLTHCYPPNGGSFIAHRAKTIGATVLTMARPLRFLNFLRFVNDAVGSTRKYDIIEAHWMYPAGIAAMIASKMTGTPYRVFCHGTDVMMAERSWFWRFWARRVLRHAKEVFAVSHFLKNKIIPLTDYNLRRFDGVHWYYPEVQVQPMEVDKGIFFDRGFVRYIPVCFIYKRNVGKYSDPMLQVEMEIGLKNRMHLDLFFVFGQFDISMRLNNCKVVVLASENEGYGLMLAEAAECGCKIIGVNEGGIPEVVAKYGGLLFDGTAEDLIKKINIALNVETGAVLQ